MEHNRVRKQTRLHKRRHQATCLHAGPWNSPSFWQVIRASLLTYGSKDIRSTRCCCASCMSIPRAALTESTFSTAAYGPRLCMFRPTPSVLALQSVRSVPGPGSLPLCRGYGWAPSQCGERTSAAGHCYFRPAHVACPTTFFVCCSLSCDVPGTFSHAALFLNLSVSADLLP